MAQAWPPLYTKPGKFSLGRGPRNSIAAVGGGAGAVGFIDTVFAQVLNANNAAITDASIRAKVPLQSGGKTQVRVTFEAASNGGFQVDNASIGVYLNGDTATVATPVELKFATASGFNLAQGTSITSDWLVFGGFTSSQFLVVVMDVSAANGTPRRHAAVTGAVTTVDAASNTFNSASTGTGPTTSLVIGVNKIEVQ